MIDSNSAERFVDKYSDFWGLSVSDIQLALQIVYLALGIDPETLDPVVPLAKQRAKKPWSSVDGASKALAYLMESWVRDADLTHVRYNDGTIMDLAKLVNYWRDYLQLDSRSWSQSGTDDLLRIAAGRPDTCALLASPRAECYLPNEYGGLNISWIAMCWSTRLGITMQPRELSAYQLLALSARKWLSLDEFRSDLQLDQQIDLEVLRIILDCVNQELYGILPTALMRPQDSTSVDDDSWMISLRIAETLERETRYTLREGTADTQDGKVNPLLGYESLYSLIIFVRDNLMAREAFA